VKLSPEERAAKKAARAEEEQKRAEETKRRNDAYTAQAQEAERKRWLPVSFVVMARALANVPIYSHHYRAKNWAAIISPDPLAPGGLKREWFSRGRGGFAYILPERLGVGDVIEFAADHVTFGGRVNPERWIGIVAELTPSLITLTPCKSAVDAFMMQSVGRALGG
jgi:hypothetical protein